ncbi:MAG: ABC transporter substrate-binding protein [Aquabacterium sp.]
MHRPTSLILLALLSAACAAQERMARVGELLWRTDGPYYEVSQRGFAAGLREQGFVEGRNLVLLQRSADNDPGRFRQLARELAQEKVDVFLAAATPMATAAWYADRRTPIVIATILDPVKLEFVKSLARPGTRVTGVTTMNKELTGKRMQILMQAVPGLRRLGVVIDDAMRDACKQEIEALDASASELGIALVYAHIAGPGDVEAGFRTLVSGRVQAVLSTLTSTRNGLEREYAEAALRHRLPTMYDADYGTRLGGLMSYGPDLADVFRRAGHYVGRVLKGEKPAGMPIEEPSTFRLTVNLKTARALGLTLPQSVMILANEVVE